jgi:hypothetical protein
MVTIRKAKSSSLWQAIISIMVSKLGTIIDIENFEL